MNTSINTQNINNTTTIKEENKMKFNKNDMVIFNCTSQDNEFLKSHNKEIASVVCPFEDTGAKYDKFDVGQMYLITFKDTSIAEVFEDELMKYIPVDKDSHLEDPYFVYGIGDNYRNDNGDTYIILAMDKEQDKAIMYKKAEDGTRLYIGARFLSMHSWGQGHYFMSDFNAACEWFNHDEYADLKAKFQTVEEFLKLHDSTFENYFFFNDMHTFTLWQFKETEIPEAFKRCKVRGYSLREYYIEAEDCGDINSGYVAGICFDVDPFNDDIDMTYVNVDYPSHKL